MDDPDANDHAHDERGSLREHAAAPRFPVQHGDTDDAGRATTRDAGYALPTLEAVGHVALALQGWPDRRGPATAPPDVDAALTLLGHAQAVLAFYELHLLDAALLGGPDGTFGGDHIEAGHAELRRAFPSSRAHLADATAPDNAPHPLNPSATAGADPSDLQPMPPPTHACGIDWGVCPQHGATLAASNKRTRCQQCERSWPGDRLNQRCREPITWKGTRHRFDDPTSPAFGLCDGHRIAASDIDDQVKLAQLVGSAEAVTGQWWDVSSTSAAYVRRRYQVPAAKRLGRITLAGRSGTILGFRGGYLQVRFDDAPDSRVLCHPTANVTYPDAAEHPGARRRQGERP